MNGVQFIVTIVTVSLFALIFFVGVLVGLYHNAKQNELNRKITKMYNDPNLAKMDYDFSAYDEEITRIVSASRMEGQITIDDVLINGTASPADEGIEEITGNYKPE